MDYIGVFYLGESYLKFYGVGDFKFFLLYDRKMKLYYYKIYLFFYFLFMILLSRKREVRSCKVII